MQLYFGLYAAMGKSFSQLYCLSSHGRKAWVTEAENKSRKLHGNCFEEFCLTFKTCFRRTTNSKQFSENIFWILSEILVTEKFFPEIVWNCFELFWIFRKIVKSRKSGLKSRKRGLKSRKRDLSHGNQDLSHGNNLQEIVSELFEIVVKLLKLFLELFQNCFGI